MGRNSGATIMMIGDDPNFCYLMRRYIRQSAHQIIFSPHGEGAIELARREKPAVILLEVDHPGSFGWSVLRALKSDEQTTFIPVVLCSWRDDDMDFDGPDYQRDIYLREPVLYEDFKAALDRLGIHSEENQS